MNPAPTQRPDGAALPFEGCARLAVTRLTLRNFRSYAEVDVAVSGAPVVLAGPNGAGKTNLLDAISLLSPGRGLRGAKLGDHVRRGPSVSSDALWAVAANVTRAGESYDVGTGLTLGPNGGERRQVRLNGAPAQNSADLGELVQMLWLTPAMDRLFIEGASGRRKFLDRLVLGFNAGHARTTTRYETAMRERARLLKFGPRDPAWLDGLEAEMVEAGLAMAMARAQTVERLNRALTARGEAGAFPAAQLALEGDTDALLVELGNDTAPALREKLERARVRDAEAGRTTVGPHLTDLAVRHTQKRADARECSTGEQKALLISIVLADAWELSQARDGHAPLLLLDEIAAHLDAVRRAALFDEILALGAQAWMTGTDIEMFAPLRSKADLFEVADSQPRPI
ncbi:MAG: DNA replication/repair protein RecF [Alphaproteobacteria bacterium]|nr:DNA replication/repair protein RecF [Alphaproteobacteria bacterium]